MENFEPHTEEKFWYNIGVSQERNDLIFDIGPRTEKSHRGIYFSVCEAYGRMRSHIRQNPGSAVSSKPPVRGAAETHPTPAASTQHQRIGFRGKAANFPQRKTEYDGASRVIRAACPLLLFFVKVLSGTSHETGFRGRAAFLSRVEAARLQATEARKE